MRRFAGVLPLFISVFFLYTLIPDSLRSADECAPSDFSAALSVSSTFYSNSSTLPGRGTHSYYVSVSAPGVVNISISSSRNRVSFSYSDRSCPNAGDPPAAASGTYTFTSAGDFNLVVYRSGRGGGGRRGGSYTIEISFTPDPPIADYRMDECGWSGLPAEVVDSSGGDNNGTLTGSGADTSPNGVVCRYGEFFGDAVDIGGLNVDTSAGGTTTLSFWVRWDGTDGAVPFGWGGYALKFSGGGFGFATGSGDLYGTDWSLLSGGWHHVAAIFVNGDVTASRLYIDGTERSLSQFAGTPDNSAAFSGSDASIGGWPGSSADRFTGGLDEMKIYRGELSAEEISAIYTNESAGRSYDGSARICNDCTDTPPIKEVLFNAVDYTTACNSLSDWDRNLTTKVAAEAFSLSILAKDRATGSPMEANVTEVRLDYFADGNTSGCTSGIYRSVVVCSGGCGLTDPNGCLFLDVPASLNDRAAKCVSVNIKGVDPSANAGSGPDESSSSDNFSIRPYAIDLLSPAADANLTAERDYYYAGGVVALYADGSSPVADYNTTLSLGAIKRMRNGEENASLAGVLSSTPTIFANGSGDLNLSFSDVANLTLFFEDTAWTAVDSDDTPLNQRRIYGERNVTFIPSRFEVQFFSAPYIEDNDSARRFTYLSNDLNMSAWARNLTVVVTAVGERNSTMRNFSSPMDRLFADPVDISPVLNLPAKHSAARSIGEPQPLSGADINFTSGQAFVSYADVPFNYDRSCNTPINPFLVSGSEGNVSVGVTDAAYPAVTGAVFSTFDANATFYYGRIRAEDIATTHPSVENAAYIEVYDEAGSAFVSGFVQNSLLWYANAKHTSGSSGRIREANATAGASLSGVQDAAISIDFSRYGSGTVSVEINNSETLPKSRTIHLDIDRWLWYVPAGFGGAYDYGASSDCSTHPCFRYSYETKGGTFGGVLSGDFNGSDFDTETMDANATFERKEGVKLFR